MMWKSIVTKWRHGSLWPHCSVNIAFADIALARQTSPIDDHMQPARLLISRSLVGWLMHLAPSTKYHSCILCDLSCHVSPMSLCQPAWVHAKIAFGCLPAECPLYAIDFHRSISGCYVGFLKHRLVNRNLWCHMGIGQPLLSSPGHWETVWICDVHLWLSTTYSLPVLN